MISDLQVGEQMKVCNVRYKMQNIARNLEQFLTLTRHQSLSESLPGEHPPLHEIEEETSCLKCHKGLTICSQRMQPIIYWHNARRENLSLTREEHSPLSLMVLSSWNIMLEGTHLSSDTRRFDLSEPGIITVRSVYIVWNHAITGETWNNGR